jgi:FAD/FMN-containing dehydrogenase/Fe-S oxidoreductase
MYITILYFQQFVKMGEPEKTQEASSPVKGDFTRKEFESELRKKIKGEVAFDTYTLGIYSTDASFYQFMPVAVVIPLDEEDVISAVRIAGKFNVSILPRGGGTSLGGQAAGESMIIDFSKYMNKILEVNIGERWARVQPGIVLDELNAFLKQYNLHFAPDPATGNRATVGGMIGNNSSGTKSIIYGITKDHVLETKTLLSDGSVVNFIDFPADGPWEGLEKKNGREYELVNGFKRIIDDNREEIRKAYPKIMRKVQGYNLDEFVSAKNWNFSKLMTGSEGTLGMVLDAKINLEPLPAKRILCTVHFDNLLECIATVSPILEHKPSAVEIMDEDVVIRARKNLSIAPLSGWIEGDPKGILVVEFFGDTEEEVREKADKLVADLKERKRGYACPVLHEPGEQAKVWAVRKNGLGLMLGIKGDRKPMAFIEDAAIPINHLPEYIDRILKFCRERDVPVAMYAHASVGLIHVRPILNLKDQADIDNMKAIARHSFEMVKEYGGSISGEHGDGRNRSPFLEEYFGPTVYNALREVKRLFDPAGIMNPGVIVDPAPMDANLRYGTGYKTPEIPTEYNFREDGSFAAAVEMCTGVGACRQNLDGLMCPSYRATRDEEHSTRGRANALRLAMTGQMGEEGLNSRTLYGIMDLCLACKGCKSECPSNVDLARLKGEFLQKYREENGTILRDRFVAASTTMARRFSGWKAPLVNGVQKTLAFRKTLEWMAGIDSRRKLPAYARKTFHNWFENRPNGTQTRPNGTQTRPNGTQTRPNGTQTRPNGTQTRQVVLFDDTYMNYHEINVGISAVELLESCGYRVILAKAGCCQRPAISHGFLKKAGAEGKKTMQNLKRYIDDGLKIVVCEPGCASALTDDLPDLIGDEELGNCVKENVMMIDVFLESEIKAGRLDAGFTSQFNKLMIHGHCHQKSLYGTTAMERVLGRIPGLQLEVLDSGCCGMAGSFGYEKEHYDLSMKVGEDRLFPAIRKKDPDTGLVACGFSCRHQIADATGVQAKHWVEVLRGSIGETPA